MTFFNSKEESIDIELTQHGKYLLSKGKWKPVYYEFYDDDVIYDSQYGGTSDKQAEINSRIKSSARPKTQYTFTGAEERVKRYLKQARDLGLPLEVLESSNAELARQNLKSQDNLANIKETLFTTSLPLGNSGLDKNYYPNIKARFIAGEISSVSSSLSLIGIPNNLYFLNLLDLKYKKYVDTTEENFGNLITNLQEAASRAIFSDQSFINVENEEIFLELTELNTDSLKDNFEISLFKIDESDGKEIEISLSFIDEQEKTKIANNVLVDNEDYNLYNENLNTGGFERPEFIEYFFEVNVDKEIPQNILCKYLPKEEINRLKIVEGYDIFCEEDEEISSITEQSISIPITEIAEEEL